MDDIIADRFRITADNVEIFGKVQTFNKAVYIGSKLTDEDLNKLDAVTEMTNRVISLGPLGGLAIYALGDDYYQAKMNYQTSRMAIQTMNPSK